MAEIHVLLPPNAEGLRVEADLDDARLLKHESLREDDDGREAGIEYCLIDCPGQAHQTQVADAQGHFCDQHVHRSVHVTKKRWPGSLSPSLHVFDLARWAEEYVNDLVRQRNEAGHPLEVTRVFTAAELDALTQVLARRPEIGTLTTKETP